jgi:polyphosphate kinase
MSSAIEKRPSESGNFLHQIEKLEGKDLYLNHELSLLEFHRRVLEEALDQSQPLLERLNFLGIFSSILDEFFMVRVSGLKESVEAEIERRSPDGMTPVEQLRQIRQRLQYMVTEQMLCLTEDVLPSLEEQGIRIKEYRSLSESEKRELEHYFHKHVFPVVTPQTVDPSHPFPYISSLSLNIGVIMEPAKLKQNVDYILTNTEPRFVRIKIPPVVPRLIKVGGQHSSTFVLVEDLIAANICSFLPGCTTGESHMFRVTRDADIEIREDEAHDLLHEIEQQIRRRRFGSAVRLEVSAKMPADMVDYLAQSIGVNADDVYVVDGPFNVPDLMSLYKINRPELKYRPLQLNTPAPIRHASSIFDAIRERDILMHHPFTSYQNVVDFIGAAAADENVLAIKMCLYRTGRESQIVQSLIEASERGKQVTVLIELKARFDEENNIEWARRLEQGGIHVVYGLLGLKTHCKLTLVVRREGEELKRYMHIASGNYNPATSNVYTDVGIFTADEEIGADSSALFNFLTSCAGKREYNRLFVAPINLREHVSELIDREIEHKRAGREARIVIKVNRIADTRMIKKLYEASQAGVPVDLIVRGICMLRPGVEGLSENIRVRSIVGRFLEHSRILYFANGGQPDVYLGSADWMPRNFNRRVEVLTPINDPYIRTYLSEEILAAYLRDNVKARILNADGAYSRVKKAPDEQNFDVQVYFENRDTMSAFNFLGLPQVEVQERVDDSVISSQTAAD